MELIDILKLSKIDSLYKIGEIVQLDNETYNVISFNQDIKSIFIKKYNGILIVKILLNENLNFKFFIKRLGANFTALYNYYDEETFFNYNYEDRVISFICDNYFVDNYNDALIKEIKIDYH